MKKYIAVAALSLSIAILSLFLGRSLDIDLSGKADFPDKSVQINVR